ncbi:MAG: hybrid sensor histidine kinase/response regulator [Desulfobacterales bacterium]|jgi:signal transduction histidine kinase|nr:hybrid sensor histidine kinase/response regulator [Desulfobacterales bacterium]
MKQTILIVDDEPDIRDVLSLALTDMGHDVRAAADGDEALRMFREARTPIVVTDIKMPGMDGIELLQKLKREDPDTEVVMITGHGDLDLAIRSLKHEATDFITKPINIDVLEIALQRAQERILTRQKLKEYTEHLEQLIREKSELQSRLSALGLMIGSISHGIKGLLTGLDGAIYLVESGFSKNDPAKISDGWQTVKLTIERVRKMMLDILFAAKERELKTERVEAAEFARELADRFGEKIRRQGVDFVREVGPGVGEFDVDSSYLQAALANILENALDACCRDESKPRHCITFRVRGESDAVVFEVGDDGPGMDSETKQKLFQLFFSSKGAHGTGLGLFVTQKIVEQHGGRIEVRSTPGHGSLFRITIPRGSSADPSAAFFA